MTNTLANNKLIAEFMGYKEYDRGMWSKPELVKIILSNTYSEEWLRDIEMKYHLSWDWLMPVVDKIETMDCFVRTESYIEANERYFVTSVLKITPRSRDNTNKVVSVFKSRLASVYDAVCEYIKWHNEQVKNNG